MLGRLKQIILAFKPISDAEALRMRLGSRPAPGMGRRELEKQGMQMRRDGRIYLDERMHRLGSDDDWTA